MRRAFIAESVAAVAAAALALLTIVDPGWIEAVFHIDPDAGSGALEWAVAAASLAAAAVCGAAARAGWDTPAS